MALHSFLFTLGALWGCTNALFKQQDGDASDDGSGDKVPSAFEKKGASLTQGVQQHNRKKPGICSWLERLVGDIFKLLCNWRFLVPFAINQSGSVLFMFLLGSSELSLAVPVCNASTFVFTLLTSLLLGEKIHGDPALLSLGVVLVIAGVTLMTLK